MRRAIRYAILTLFAVFFLCPFVLSAATSFKTRPDVAAHAASPWPHEFSIRAWTDVFLHSDFPLWTFNSLLVTVLATLARIFIDSLAGYSTGRASSRRTGTWCCRWPARPC